MGSSKSQVVGYDYYFGIHMGISRGPVDEICEIKVGDRTVWPYTATKLAEAIAGAVPIDKTIELPSSSLYGSHINALGENEIYIVLPFAATDPPFTPGQHARLTGFRRNILDESLGSNAYREINLSGDYVIYAVAQFASNDPGNESNTLGDNADGAARLWLRAPAAQFANWTDYTLLPSVPLGDVAVSIEAIDYSAVPPPPPPTEDETEEALGITDNRNVLIDAYDVFGGREGEGGIKGWLQTMMGDATQNIAGGLWAMLGSPERYSAYRGMCTVFFDGVVAAINPYPKAWGFRVRRVMKGWDGDVWHPELAKIVLTRPLGAADTTRTTKIHAMNPAHIIFECLTNREWGRGLDRAMIDEASFLNSATLLHGEQFGLCLRWSRRDTISEFIKSILEHIGGVMHPDRTTAKIRLELIRGGYDFNSLPLLTSETGLLSISEGSVTSSPALINEIQVSYTDPLTGDDQTVSVQNLASLQATGGQFNSLKKDYPGIPTPDLARRVAQRDLRAYGTGLRKFTLTCDRRAWNITPGSVIRIQDPIRGILPMALRVGPTRDGTLIDGRITINAVQDVFSLPASSYLGHQLPQWEPPNTLPCLGRHEVFEMPYFLLAARLSAADFAQVTPEAARVGVVLEQGRPLNNSFEIATRNGASTPDDVPTSDAYFCGYEA